jgi:hypothetical protein
VQETGFIANVFGHVGQKGDDVVFDLALDLVDAGRIERGALTDRFGYASGVQMAATSGRVYLGIMQNARRRESSSSFSSNLQFCQRLRRRGATE